MEKGEARHGEKWGKTGRGQSPDAGGTRRERERDRRCALAFVRPAVLTCRYIDIVIICKFVTYVRMNRRKPNRELVHVIKEQHTHTRVALEELSRKRRSSIAIRPTKRDFCFQSKISIPRASGARVVSTLRVPLESRLHRSRSTFSTRRVRDSIPETRRWGWSGLENDRGRSRDPASFVSTTLNVSSN